MLYLHVLHVTCIKIKDVGATINKKNVDSIDDNDNTSGYANNDINTSCADHHVTMTTIEVEERARKKRHLPHLLSSN